MEMIEIVAKEGMWLTQSAILEDDSTRVFVKKVYTKDASTWRDATDEEKRQWEEEHLIPENIEE